MTNTPTPFQETWAPRALGLLRIVTGYMFIWHGTAKLFGRNRKVNRLQENVLCRSGLRLRRV